MTIQDAIKKVVSGTSLSISETKEVFSEIMSGNATDAQIGALIIAMRMKGETIEEITGAAAVMREKATHVIPVKHVHTVDTCGTGGDGSNTFNISTATAFVAAASGAAVAKHGNRNMSSKCGSADVLEALGINIAISADLMRDCLDTLGICFLFAPALHKAMKYAIGPRKEIGVRTIFNVLGPLTNPALASSQLMGVFSADLTGKMAQVLANMGTKKAYVVYGMEGLDEISMCGPTQISELHNGSVKTYTICPEDFGFKRTTLDSIRGGDAKENAQIISGIFRGDRGPGRDIVVLNAAFALAASGVVANPKDGILLATQTIDSGAALKKVEALASMSNSSTVTA